MSLEIVTTANDEGVAVNTATVKLNDGTTSPPADANPSNDVAQVTTKVGPPPPGRPRPPRPGGDSGSGSGGPGGSPGGGPGKGGAACSGLKAKALKTCQAKERFKKATAQCAKIKAKTQKGKKQKAACLKKATIAYKRDLALIACQSIKNNAKRTACIKRARGKAHPG
jgi:hypothetical protein